MCIRRLLRRCSLRPICALKFTASKQQKSERMRRRGGASERTARTRKGLVHRGHRGEVRLQFPTAVEICHVTIHQADVATTAE
jgi:hypothetical protein